MSKTIRLGLCAAISLAVTQFVAGQAEPASPSDVVRELYVPLDDLNVLLENQPRRVLLTRSEFDELLAQARIQPKMAAPVAAAILSGDYEAVVDQERARIQGRLTIDVMEEGLRALPLDLAGVGLIRADLDSRSAAIGRDPAGKPTLFLEGVGRHELTLELVTPLTTSAAQQTLRFRLPAAATSTLRLTVPGDVEIKSGARVVNRNFDAGAGRTRFELLAQGETNIVMTLNSHLLRQERSVLAKAVLVDEVTRNYERLHATFAMAVLHKAVDSFRLLIPEGFEVTQVQSPLLARWSTDSNGREQSVLDIRLREPTTQIEVINISAIRTAAPPTPWALPTIRAIDVLGEVSVVGLLLEDRMQVQGIESTNLIPIDTAVLTQALPASVFQAEPGAPQLRPVAAYYAPQSEYRLAAGFQAPAAQLRVTTDMLLTLTEKDQQLRAGFTLLPEWEKLFAADVVVPENWQVTGVTAADGTALSFERFAERVHVRLPKGIASGEPFSLLVQANWSPPGWLGEWSSTPISFPALRVAETTKFTGVLAVMADGDFLVRPDASERLAPLDQADRQRLGLPPTAAALAYRIDSPDYRADFTVERVLPRLTAQTYSFFIVQPDLLTAHYELAYDVEQAKVQRLVLSLPATTPENLSIAGLDGCAIKEFTSRLEGDRRHWTVLLAEARGDAIRLAVDFQQPLKAEVQQVELPVIRGENLAHQAGFVAVEGSPEIDVKVATPLRKVDIGELAGARHQVGKRLIGAYWFASESPKVEISMVRHPAHDLPSMLVERAELLTLLDGHGLSQNAARLLLRTKDPWIEVELPEGAKLWAARVDGETIKPQRDDKYLLFEVPGAGEVALRDLQFVYELAVPAAGFRRQVELFAPKLLLRRSGQARGTSLPVADLSWQLCAPEGYRITRASGTVDTADVADEELALTRLCGNLYRLAGGIQLFYLEHLSETRSQARLAASTVSGQDKAPLAFMFESPSSDVDGDGPADLPSSSRRGSLRFDVESMGVAQEAQLGEGQLPEGATRGGDMVVTAPAAPPPPQASVARAFWALEGVRSLEIELEPQGPGMTFHSFGSDPRLDVTLLNERRSDALAWAIACAAGLWGLRLVRRPVRHRVRYVLIVALAATLIPLITGSPLLTILLNPSFVVAAWLVPLYFVVAAIRRLAKLLQPSPLNVPAATVVLVAMLLATGRPAGAASPANPPDNDCGPPVEVPQDAIIVPYDPTSSAGPGGATQIMVPYGLYTELWNQVHPQDAPTSDRGPVRYAFGGVVVRANLAGEEHLLVEAEADLDVYADGPIVVELPLTGGVLMKAQLDGQPARLGVPAAPPAPPAQQAVPDRSSVEAASLVLSVSGKGRHRLTLAARMKLQRAGGWRVVRGSLIGVDSGLLSLAVPEPHTEVQLTDVPDRTAYVTSAADERIETALSPGGRIAFQWRPRVSEGVVDQSLTAESDAVFDVQEDGTRLAWRTALEFRRGERASFEFDLPNGYQVSGVNGPNVRGWETVPTADKQQLQVTLLKPAKDREQLEIHLSRRGPVGSAAWPEVDVPSISVPEASLHHGQLTIRRSPMLELRSTGVQGASRIDLRATPGSPERAMSVDSPLGIRPFAAYRFAALPFSIKLSAAPTEGHVTAKTEAILRITPRERTLETRVLLEVKERPIYQASLLLPGDLQLERVSVPGAFEWAATPEDQRLRLDIVLAAGRSGTVPILINGRLGESGPADRVPLPAIEVAGVQRQEGDIVVQTDAGWQVEASGLEQCEPILLRRVHDWLTPPQRESARLALHFTAPDYRGQLQLVALTPLVRCQTISNVRVTDRAIEETILLDLTVDRAGIRELSFLVPEWMKDARISVPQLQQKTIEAAGAGEAGFVRVRLLLQDRLLGQLRVLVESDRALNREQNQVPIPAVDGVQTDQRYVLLENVGRYELEVVGQEGLSPVGRQQSEWQRLTRVLGGNITSAYLVDSGAARPRLAYQTKDRATVDTVGARIGLAQTWLSVDQSGTYRAVQSLRVDNSTEQFMEIALPAGADLWTAQVAGESVKPTQTGDPNKPRHVLIPLVKTATGDLDYEVLLKYGGRLDELGGLSRLTIPLVRPVNIVAELSQVRLYLPEGFRWFDFDGTMTRSADESGLAAGFIAYQTQRAKKLVQALGNASSYSKVRAVASLEKLKFESDSYSRSAGETDEGVARQWKENAQILEDAVKAGQAAGQELDKLEVSIDNRYNLGLYYDDQTVKLSEGERQGGGANFVLDLSSADVKSADVKGQQFDDAWFAANGLTPQSVPATGGRARVEDTGRQRVRGEVAAPMNAPAQPAGPQVIDRAQVIPQAKGDSLGKGAKKPKSLETLEQYQQALRQQRRPEPGSGERLDEELQREWRFSRSTHESRDAAMAGRSVAATQPAALATGLASLDVDIRHRGNVYRFTAPRGEATITVRAISGSTVGTMWRIGTALLLVVLVWLGVRVAWPFLRSALTRSKAGLAIILLGIISLATGILPLAGLLLSVLGVVVVVRGRMAAPEVRP